MDKIQLVGYASGIAGVDLMCGRGPVVIQQSAALSSSVEWHTMISPPAETSQDQYQVVQQECTLLAKTLASLVRKCPLPVVIGGDHSCAIGTWSGAYDALHSYGDMGLIWIDAHMDSHTPETSLSGRIHGMGLAALLGQGSTKLTHILHSAPKFKPKNVCLIGVRSYEAGEAQLLKGLNVRVYFIDEVKERGLSAVLQEAIVHVNKNTLGYGVSIDLDSIDPMDAPGVDVPEPNGIALTEMQAGLMTIAQDARLIALEIAEFDPSRDQQRRTEKIIISFLDIIAKQKRLIRGEV